jgi:hypothetical protein
MSKGPMSDEQKELRRLGALKNRESHSKLMIKYWKDRKDKEKQKDNSFMKYLNKHNK